MGSEIIGIAALVFAWISAAINHLMIKKRVEKKAKETPFYGEGLGGQNLNDFVVRPEDPAWDDNADG